MLTGPIHIKCGFYITPLRHVSYRGIKMSGKKLFILLMRTKLGYLKHYSSLYLWLKVITPALYIKHKFLPYSTSSRKFYDSLYVYHTRAINNLCDGMSVNLLPHIISNDHFYIVELSVITYHTFYNACIWIKHRLHLLNTCDLSIQMMRGR